MPQALDTLTPVRFSYISWIFILFLIFVFKFTFIASISNIPIIWPVFNNTGLVRLLYAVKLLSKSDKDGLCAVTWFDLFNSYMLYKRCCRCGEFRSDSGMQLVSATQVAGGVVPGPRDRRGRTRGRRLPTAEHAHRAGLRYAHRGTVYSYTRILSQVTGNFWLFALE